MGREKLKPNGKGPFLGGLCFITDRRSCQLTPVEMTSLVLKAGIRWIQYRDKEKDRLDFYRTAVKLRDITSDFGACFTVNDHADIAIAVEADGVHLGQDDLPLAQVRKIVGEEMIVGISTHTLDEAVGAQEGGADYIGFGPVYETSTKKEAGNPRGAEVVTHIRENVDIPVVAIGGIDCDCLNELFSNGAKAVAVASAILRGDDICSRAEEFVTAIKECTSH